MRLLLGAAVLALAGCAGAATGPQANGEPFAFRGEALIPVRLEHDARVVYAVLPQDDLTTMDTCFLHEADLPAWRADRAQGIACDSPAAGADGDVRVGPGRYLLALHCRADYVEGRCHVRVTLDVHPA